MRRGIGILLGAVAALGAAAPARALEFQPYEAYPTSSWPEVVKIGDVTGDGRNDVLLATSFYFDEENDYRLFVFAQQADGSFAAPKKYAVSGGFGIGDLTGDGKADVAVATYEGVKVLEQSGGALGEPRLLVNSPSAGDAEIADMNGDGRNDVVVSGERVWVLTNEGGGSFRYSTIGQGGVGDLELADVNADGLLDVAGLGGGFTQYLHAADGTYGVRSYGLANGANGMALGDLTGDQRIDGAFSAGGNSPGAKMVVIPQTADGTPSTTAQVYTSYDIPEPVDARDMNGDGRTDVITVHGGWNALGVYLQSAEGTLQSEKLFGVPYASHYNLKGVDTGDIDCDGRPDVVIADYNHGLVVLRQPPPASKPSSCPPPDPTPKGGATPPPPADPPPAGATPTTGTSGSGPGTGGSLGSSGAGAGQTAPGVTAYGGGIRLRRGIGATSVGLVRRADGTIAGRAGLALRCGKTVFTNVVVRLAGLASGDGFRADGDTKLTRRGRLRLEIAGKFEGANAIGTIRATTRRIGCRTFTRPLFLRSAAAPAGAPALAPAGAVFAGLTSQVASEVPLPVLVHVSRSRRSVSALWQATMSCGPRAQTTVVNFTPPTRVRGDGTFSRTETYTLRYPDGSRDRFHVTFAGRFLADGATGTLDARMQTRKRGVRYLACSSGRQTWSAAG